MAIGRPARARLSFLAIGELHRLATRDLYAPDVAHAFVRFPIGFRESIKKLASIGGKLRAPELGHFDQVDNRHRVLRLRCDEGGRQASHETRKNSS